MTLVKFLHVATALISICGFAARGYLKMRQSSLLEKTWLKVIPHINDTLLLVSAILLVMNSGYDLTQTPWLMAKITGLILYIFAGMAFMRLAKTLPQQLFGYFLAISLFGYIVAVAISKSPLPLS